MSSTRNNIASKGDAILRGFTALELVKRGEGEGVLRRSSFLAICTLECYQAMDGLHSRLSVQPIPDLGFNHFVRYLQQSNFVLPSSAHPLIFPFKDGERVQKSGEME